jgi:hypothetical protein
MSAFEIGLTIVCVLAILGMWSYDNTRKEDLGEMFPEAAEASYAALEVLREGVRTGRIPADDFDRVVKQTLLCLDIRTVRTYHYTPAKKVASE